MHVAHSHVADAVVQHGESWGWMGVGGWGWMGVGGWGSARMFNCHISMCASVQRFLLLPPHLFTHSTITHKPESGPARRTLTPPLSLNLKMKCASLRSRDICNANVHNWCTSSCGCMYACIARMCVTFGGANTSTYCC